MFLIFCLSLSVFRLLSLAQLRLEEQTPEAELKDCIECDVPWPHLISLSLPKSKNLGLRCARAVSILLIRFQVAAVAMGIRV